MNNLYLVTAPEMDLMVSAPTPHMAVVFWREYYELEESYIEPLTLGIPKMASKDWASLCRIWEVQHSPKLPGALGWNNLCHAAGRMQLIGWIEE